MLGVAWDSRLGKGTEALKKEQLGIKAHVADTTTLITDVTIRNGHLAAILAHDADDTGWIIDSGATNHMMYGSDLFSTTISSHCNRVLTANNYAIHVMGDGSINLTHTLSLDKVLLVSSLFSNLLYVPHVIEQ
ncbi:unnamed protein product [Prunus armeniaca]